MRKFDNPLDNVRIASPCPADWKQMYGDDRQRHCPECKLNVFNLSGMTKREAENLLLETEGRLCVRFFTRSDGTILTKDCPVGWQAIKRRTRRITSAIASFALGILSGVSAARVAETAVSLLPMGDVPAPAIDGVSKADVKHDVPMVGQMIIPLQPKRGLMVGRIQQVQKLSNEKVVAWIK
jgi:hypothetical protein